MPLKNLLMAFAILAAVAAPLSAASTVTLTGSCPLHLINSSRSYITFNVTNTGDGTASDLIISANFTGIDPQNATAVIPDVGPNSSYSKVFHLSSLVGQGSYAVNMKATYVQSGSNYATVFPCIIYIGSLAGGLLIEQVSVKGNRMSVNITNTAPQAIEAQVTAVVPPTFTVQNPDKAVTVEANGHTALYFTIAAPSYTDASFPIIGELSYEYNGTHYAQMASTALVFGAGGSTRGVGGLGPIGWALAAIIVVILVLIIASLVRGARKGAGHGKAEAGK